MSNLVTKTDFIILYQALIEKFQQIIQKLNLLKINLKSQKGILVLLFWKIYSLME